MMEAVKKSFDENGITIPYPQIDVHIKNDSAAEQPANKEKFN